LRNFREFDEGQLRTKLSVLKRWQKWYESKYPTEEEHPYWLPPAKAVSAFLASVSEGGPTAASGAYQGLLWWRNYVGVPFHLDDPCSSSYKTKDAGHAELPAKPVNVIVFEKFLKLAMAGQGSISIFAALAILLLTACLRYAHLQRSTKLHVRGGFLVATCTRGKRRVAGVRPPFEWASPMILQKGVSPFDQVLVLYAEMEQRLGAPPTFIIPDMAIIDRKLTASSLIMAKPMPLAKFTNIFQSLLLGFGVPEPDSLEFTSYSLRRFLPTLADIFQMESEHKAALGNWVECPTAASTTSSAAASGRCGVRPRAQATMAQRYAEDKTLTSGAIKQRVLVMLSMAQAEIGAREASWSQLRSVTPTHDEVTRELRDQQWHAREPLLPGPLDAGVDEAAETVSAATSSDNDEPSTGDEEEPITTAADFVWFQQNDEGPRHVLQRITHDSRGALIPWCRNVSFKLPHAARGTGLAKGMLLCTACIKRAPMCISRAITALE
jgi:hypothetical protein